MITEHCFAMTVIGPHLSNKAFKAMHSKLYSADTA